MLLPSPTVTSTLTRRIFSAPKATPALVVGTAASGSDAAADDRRAADTEAGAKAADAPTTCFAVESDPGFPRDLQAAVHTQHSTMAPAIVPSTAPVISPLVRWAVLEACSAGAAATTYSAARKETLNATGASLPVQLAQELAKRARSGEEGEARRAAIRACTSRASAVALPSWPNAIATERGRAS